MDARARAASLAIWRGPVEPVPVGGGITNANFLVEDAGRRAGGRMAGHGFVQKHGRVRQRGFFIHLNGSAKKPLIIPEYVISGSVLRVMIRVFRPSRLKSS